MLHNGGVSGAYITFKLGSAGHSSQSTLRSIHGLHLESTPEMSNIK